ncbi:hypothetical protein BWQ96_03784 [Gracilariopsis chorda]|uniref:Uncharacterized protein n=1 Tax=Gracilariopsis chorda TaxID=448386 RepID=A0A2V3IWJ5_9FLOR|nr:hypothetical protein BWQ96_03784 [Gracilariopsis chorda]|eukprot:PXF46459.1 hypothetical protein BWQ96_03784 [Gracilariopsis chorda]
MKLFSFFLVLALLGVCLAVPTEDAVAVGDKLEENLGAVLAEQADHEVIDASERLGDVSDIEELEDEAIDAAERFEDVSGIDEVNDDDNIGLDVSDRSYCKYYTYHCYRLKCRRRRFPYKYRGYGGKGKGKLKCTKKNFSRRYKPSCLWKKTCWCTKKCRYY